MFEKPYNDIIDRDMIVFPTLLRSAKQLVKVNVGSFGNGLLLSRMNIVLLFQ